MIVTIWLTNSCNLKCRYCYEEKHKEFISKETLDDIFEFLMVNNKFTNESLIVIHGGEPFLNYDGMRYIIKKVEKIKEQKGINIRFTMTTNGTLLDDEKINFIVKNIPEISISIDGRKQTHDFNRKFKNGLGTFDRVIENTKKLLKKMPNIRVRMTFDSKTVRNLFEDIKFLVDIGVKCIVACPNEFDLDWNIKHDIELEKQVIKINEKYKETELLLNLIDLEYINKGKCSYGRNNINIDVFGDIYPCTIAVGLPKYKIGNIYTGINLKKRERLIDFLEKEQSECNGCDIMNVCMGNRCRIVNDILYKDPRVPQKINCALENIKYKLI